MGELAAIVLEDPKLRHLPSQFPRVADLVRAFDPHEDGDARADLAGHRTVDGDSGFGDPLTNRPHRAPIISAARPGPVASSSYTHARVPTRVGV